MDVRVGQRGQVVIPADLRRRMALGTGDRLSIELDDRGRLILERLDPDPLAHLASAGHALWAGQDPVEHQRDLRDDRRPAPLTTAQSCSSASSSA